MPDRDALTRRGCVVILICLLSLTSAVGPAPARAAPATAHQYVVNSLLDEPDADPSTGLCASTPSAKCTLRAAIMAADFVAGPTTILLPAGTYTLTRPGYDDTALVGDLDISHDLTLQGAGAAATVVDAAGPVTHDRVFQVLATAHTVTLSGLTLRNGQSFSSTVGTIGGGGLLIEGAGQLTLSDVTVQANSAQNGGGLYANFAGQGGTLVLDHVSLRANTVTAGGVGAGGGLLAHLPDSTNVLDVHDSLVYSNTADGTGGGFYVDGSAVTVWSIARSQIYSNTAGSGGGIGNFVRLVLTDSRLHDNHAAFDGGAIEAFAPLAITRTTLDANGAQRFGGALFDLQQTGGGPPFAGVVQSTFSGNYAQYGGAIYHDGFIVPGSLINLTNSTLSGNGVFRPGSASGTADGGGLYVYGGQAQLFNTTIANNHVQLGLPPHVYSGLGGGVYITATAVFTAVDSIVANNYRGDGLRPSTADDCFAHNTTGTLSFDLILTTTDCFVTGPQGNNLVGQDPLLGVLQDNGGATQTQALSNGSPALAAGIAAGCQNANGSPLTYDQRGALRPTPTCDLGAYTLVPEADLAVGQRVSLSPVRLGAPLTYTVYVTNTGPVTVTGVVLTDTLPASATLKLANTGTIYGCPGTAVLVCNFGPLALPAGARLTVTVAVSPAVSGLITNTVTVSAGAFDPALANNTAYQVATVERDLFLPLLRGP